MFVYLFFKLYEMLVELLFLGIFCNQTVLGLEIAQDDFRVPSIFWERREFHDMCHGQRLYRCRSLRNIPVRMLIEWELHGNVMSYITSYM